MYEWCERGVQRLIQNELKREILYVHCYNHRLHLVVVDLVSTLPQLGQYFDNIEMIYKLFRKDNVDSKYEGTSIKRVLDTRWTGHLSATQAISKNAIAIQDALLAITSSSSSAAEDVIMASGLANILKSKQLGFCAAMMELVLGILEPVDSTLQSRKTDLNEAMLLIDATLKTFASSRSDAKFEELLREADSMQQAEQAVEIDNRPQRKKVVSKRLADFVVTDRIGQVENSVSENDQLKALLYDAIDTIISEMKRRFQENGWLYEAVRALSRASKNYLDPASLSSFKKRGLKIPPPAELEIFKHVIAQTVPEGDPQEFNKVLKVLYEQKLALPCTYALYASVATLGSSTAICESTSFSTLTKIDTPQRRGMADTRQQNLVLLAFEKKRTEQISIEKFLTQFSKEHTWLQLFSTVEHFHEHVLIPMIS